MKRLYTKIVLLLIVCTPLLKGQSTVKLSQTILSETFQDSIAYTIYLPPNYSHNNKYPILYLLHGINGDETSIIKTLRIEIILDSLIANNTLPEVIVIMPDGRRSYYINDYKNQFPFEDIFIKDFIPAIENMYPASIRAISGMSMGGFGATILPIKHPELFSTSINLSGAVRTSGQFINLSQATYQNYFGPIFGDSLVGINRITEHWKANTPYLLVNSKTAKQLRSINWYIDCGLQDYLLPANKALHFLFVQNKIEHEFRTKPGVHNWSYWRKGLIDALVYWGELLKTSNEDLLIKN